MSLLMPVKAEWVEQFRVSQENLEKWRREAGPRTDLLRWCLLNGKITESAYLQWACEHYELPTVEAQYFSLPPDTDFWDKVAAEGPWNEGLFPLHEWQGVWLIACIAPDTDAKFAKPHRFVLSSARALDMLWKTLNHGFENRSKTGFDKTATATLPLQSKAGTAPTAPIPQEDAPDGFGAAPDGIVVPDLFKEAPAAAAAPEPDEITAGPAVEAPDGFAGFIGSESDAPELGSAQSDALSALSFEMPAALDDEKTPVGEITKPDMVGMASLVIDAPPPGITPPSVGSPSPNSLSAGSPAVGTPAAEKKARDSATAQTPPMSTPPATPLTTPLTPPLNASLATPPKAGFAFARETTGFTATAKVPAEAAKPKEPATPSRGSIDMSQIEAVQFSGRTPSGATDFRQCPSLEEVTELAFAKMQGIFRKALMLVFQGGHLRPWKWTGDVTYAGKGKPDPIDLVPASIFKIVYTTALPYHGYIVPNPINNAFFADFNDGANPGHVTIMPVMVNGQIAGMLMGMTDAQLNLKAVLRQMEALTGDVSAALTRIRSSKAA